MSSAGWSKSGAVGAHVHALAVAAVLDGALAAGLVDEDVAHGAGGGGEEVAAGVPAGVRITDKAQVGLVDEGGGLEGVAGGRFGESRAGEGAEFVVDEGQEFGGGVGIAGAERFERDGHAMARCVSQGTLRSGHAGVAPHCPDQGMPGQGRFRSLRDGQHGPAPD
jgi:hypothetical protein